MVVVELLVAERQGDGAVELFRLVRWLRDPDLEPHHFARVLDELAVVAGQHRDVCDVLCRLQVIQCCNFTDFYYRRW